MKTETKTYRHEEMTGHMTFVAGTVKRRAIRALDLEPIKFKLVKEKGWTLQDVDRVEKLYKGYLLLNALMPDEVHVPTFEIDEMWHAHILDTYKYMQDCQRIFGYYLHHFPYLGLRGEEDKTDSDEKFEATRQRFLTFTGLDILARGDDLSAAECGGGGGCGGGGSSCGGGSSSCCSSPSSCGGGSCPSPASTPSLPFNDPASPDGDRKKDKDKPKATPPAKPSLWDRILGLSGRSDGLSALRHNPMRIDERPGRAALLRLAEMHRSETKH